MSFMSTIRSLGRNSRTLEPAVARAAAIARRDHLVSAAIVRAGTPPRI
jgi:hypothetical protein